MSVVVPDDYLQDKKYAQNELNVSRGTMEMLEDFASECLRWNDKINLISAKTKFAFWTRHILDSAQLFPRLPANAKRIADIGTGGGFPGLILAIIGKTALPNASFCFIESDARKSAFLSHMVRRQGLNGNVIAKRIEETEAIQADVITSRALAPLSDLLELSTNHLAPGGKLIFLKGRNVDAEIESALETWRFTHQKRDSITDSQAAIVEISAPFERRDENE